MEISALIAQPPYALPYAQKEEALMPILKAQLLRAAEQNPHIRSWFAKAAIHVASLKRFSDIPFLPAQMFKSFDLATVPATQVFKVLCSSATTSQRPSRIPLDKETGYRQTAGLVAILRHYLGDKRKVLLVFDHDDTNRTGTELTARGAGVRGLSACAKRVHYLLKERPDHSLTIDWDALAEVCKTHGGEEEVFGFGFTFIIWSVFQRQYVEALRRGLTVPTLQFKRLQLFHSGGWKKLKDQAVTKEEFNRSLASVLHTSASDIRDFYGMAEQAGVIFVDCECGFKHVPNFAAVLFRDPYSLQPVGRDQPGLIEVISALPTSYYGQAVLTEDLGCLRGIDDCPCGRNGERFHFLSRVEHVEVRGCGDTFQSPEPEREYAHA